jgi:tRNA pseudouridine13 synthase
MALVRGDLEGFERAMGRPAAATERRLRSLCISAVQSEAFNRVLALRMPQIGSLGSGDVATIHASGASFVVEDAAVEQPRADRFEISPSGPIVGTRLLRGFGGPRAVEDAVFESLGIAPESFAALPLGHEAHGARRPLRIAASALEHRFEGSDLWLSFSLPSGSYATVLIAELLGDPQQNARSEDRGGEAPAD